MVDVTARDPRLPLAVVALLGVGAFVAYRIVSPKASDPSAGASGPASVSESSRPFRVRVGNTDRETLAPPEETARAPAPRRSLLRRERPDARWVWENPAPLGDGVVHASWSTSANDAGVVGERGLVARWDGVAWKHIPTEISVVLRAAWARDSDDVWIAGDGCTVLRADRTRVTAMPIDGCRSTSLRGISGTSASDVWVVGSGGYAAHYDGVRWTSPPTSTQAELFAVHATSERDVWVSGADVILRWDGGAFTATKLPDGVRGLVSGVWASGPKDAWAVGAGVLRWDGARWTRIDERYGFGRVWGSGPSSVVIGGGRTALHYDGKGLREVPIPLANVAALSGSGPRDLWAAGGSDVARWDGDSWREASTAVARHSFLSAVHGTSGADVWAVGDGVVLHRDRDGAWAKPQCGAPPGKCGGVAVFAVSRDDAWAVGYDGSALHWDGARWDPVKTATTKHLFGVWASGPTDVWAVGDDGVVLRGDKGGLAVVDNLAALRLQGVWGTSPRDVWLVGSVVFHWDGERFSRVPTASHEKGASAVWGREREVWLGGLEAVGGSGLTSVQRWDGARFENVGPVFATRALHGAGDELWAVGGAAGQGGVGAVRVLRKGGDWAEIEGLVTMRTGGVWSDGKSVWIVGERAGILRRDL